MQTTKTIWVNGCFDILHRGHIELLQHAKQQGDKLVVGIDSDARVAKGKGPHRPFNTFEDRKYILESIEAVDKVVGFGSDEELEDCIKKERPFCIIVGSDWEGKNIIGQQFSETVIFFERVEGYSTTNILGDSQ